VQVMGLNAPSRFEPKAPIVSLIAWFTDSKKGDTAPRDPPRASGGIVIHLGDTLAVISASLKVHSPSTAPSEPLNRARLAASTNS
jgi:hypothetical protein